MSHIIMISGGTKYDGDYLSGVTLPFPDPTEAEKKKDAQAAIASVIRGMAASKRLQAKAAERKARRTRRALSNIVRGGFRTPAPGNRAHAPLAVAPSTRGERRRIKLGRSKPAGQSAVEVFGSK